MNPKRAGKAFETEIEQHLMDLAGQTRDMDIRNRTHRIFTSGAQISDEGDIITNIPWLKKQLLIECKRRRSSTKKEGPHLDVSLAWLAQIKREAEVRQCEPIFVGAFTGRKQGRIFVIRLKNSSDQLCEYMTPLSSNRANTFRILQRTVKVFKNRVLELGIATQETWVIMDWATFAEQLNKQKLLSEEIKKEAL